MHVACAEHEGVYGFSVQCAAGLGAQELATGCPNNWVGFATVGQIRALGYNVVITSGRGHHETVVVPRDWTLRDSTQLSQLFGALQNPRPRRRA